MAKQAQGRRSVATHKSATIKLEQEEFGSLSATHREKFVRRIGRELDRVMAWLDAKRDQPQEIARVTKVLEEIAAALSKAESGADLLRQIFRERSRRAAEKVPREVRAAAARKGSAAMTAVQRSNRASKAAQASAAKLTDEQRSERARRAAEARWAREKTERRRD
jgi:hypothetical protein